MRSTNVAWITGTHQHILDPADLSPAGCRLAGTWPDFTSKA